MIIGVFMEIKDEYDIIVVGGGPAGSSAAEACAKNGLSVLLLEKRAEIGAPKRCGEGLSDNSVKALKLKIPKNCIRQNINGAYIYAPNGKDIKIQFKGSQGYIVERKMFDKWLAENASRAGAKIITKADVYDLIIENIAGKDFVKGVKVNIMGKEYAIKSKIVVAADGVESLTMRKAGIRSNKNPKLVDSGFQYEMCNIKLRDSHMIELYLGNKIARRGYVWIFPKGKNIANVGIGILGSGCEKTAKQYLDEFIESKNELKKGSILEVNAGCVPVGGLMKNMVGNGIVGVGDAVNQVNPIHGGGIAESIFSGRIAGEVITKAIKKGDYSEKFLSEYNKIWWKKRGKRLENIEKIREAFENMSDENMNDLSGILRGEDLTDFTRGNYAKLAKIMIKYKIKSLVRFVGV